jgi:hypothetical protein
MTADLGHRRRHERQQNHLTTAGRFEIENQYGNEGLPRDLK